MQMSANVPNTGVICNQGILGELMRSVAREGTLNFNGLLLIWFQISIVSNKLGRPVWTLIWRNLSKDWCGNIWEDRWRNQSLLGTPVFWIWWIYQALPDVLDILCVFINLIYCISVGPLVLMFSTYWAIIAISHTFLPQNHMLMHCLRTWSYSAEECIKISHCWLEAHMCGFFQRSLGSYLWHPNWCRKKQVFFQIYEIGLLSQNCLESHNRSLQIKPK